MPSLPRFLQLFLLSALVLLVPSALYLSRPPHSPASDAKLAAPAEHMGSQGWGAEPARLWEGVMGAMGKEGKKEAAEAGGVIMAKMGNATAK